MNALRISNFAQPMAPLTPLPRGHSLWLPSGHISAQDNGRLLSFGGRWVVAVGLSERVFLIARERTEHFLPGSLVHELMGYLTACGVDLIPLPYRFPLAWRQGTSFASVCTLWAAQFFETSQSHLFDAPLPLSNDPRIYLPLGSLAMDGALFWEDVTAVANAVFEEPKMPRGSFRSKLTRISQTWERRWNDTLAQASEKEFSEEDRGWVIRCDLAWQTFVRAHLEPHGYQMLPASLAKVL